MKLTDVLIHLTSSAINNNVKVWFAIQMYLIRWNIQTCMVHFWTVSPPDKNFIIGTNGVKYVEVLHHFTTVKKQPKIYGQGK